MNLCMWHVLFYIIYKIPYHCPYTSHTTISHQPFWPQACTKNLLATNMVPCRLLTSPLSSIGHCFFYAFKKIVPFKLWSPALSCSMTEVLNWCLWVLAIYFLTLKICKIKTCQINFETQDTASFVQSEQTRLNSLNIVFCVVMYIEFMHQYLNCRCIIKYILST